MDTFYIISIGAIFTGIAVAIFRDRSFNAKLEGLQKIRIELNNLLIEADNFSCEKNSLDTNIESLSLTTYSIFDINNVISPDHKKNSKPCVAQTILFGPSDFSRTPEYDLLQKLHHINKTPREETAYPQRSFETSYAHI